MQSSLHRRLQNRACDRCYTAKERCTWLQSEETLKTCERCSRLKQACHNNRPLTRIGRRRAHPAGDRMLLCKVSDNATDSALATELDSTRSSAIIPTVLSVRVAPMSSAQAPSPRLSGIALQLRMTLSSELSDLEISLLNSVLHKGIQVDKSHRTHPPR